MAIKHEGGPARAAEQKRAEKDSDLAKRPNLTPLEKNQPTYHFFFMKLEGLEAPTPYSHSAHTFRR